MGGLGQRVSSFLPKTKSSVALVPLVKHHVPDGAALSTGAWSSARWPRGLFQGPVQRKVRIVGVFLQYCRDSAQRAQGVAFALQTPVPSPAPKSDQTSPRTLLRGTVSGSEELPAVPAEE